METESGVRWAAVLCAWHSDNFLCIGAKGGGGELMRAVDCFCSAGGTCCGLQQAGYDVVLGIDCDEQALAVYRANHAHPAMALDLSDEPRAVETIRHMAPIDLLAGSPPCQDFSCSGSRVEGPRASLTVSFVRIAVSLLPRVVLIENVPQVLLSDTWKVARALLESAQYRVIELRINAAACGVATVRRRVFVIAVRDCAERLVQQIVHDASGYNRTPTDARTVSDCIASSAVTYFFPARNRHQPMVRATNRPAPTLMCGCLAMPPLHYTPRHEDQGSLRKAHNLSVADAAAITSFSVGYFNRVARSVAGRLIGNAVPPAMAAIVGTWCFRLLASPVVQLVMQPLHPPPPGTQRSGHRRSRIERLVEAGMLSYGAVLDCEGLHYVCGGEGDALLQHVLHWRPCAGWTLLLRQRRGSSRSVHAPLDDLYLTAPGVPQPFRSCKQAVRWAALPKNMKAVE